MSVVHRTPITIAQGSQLKTNDVSAIVFLRMRELLVDGFLYTRVRQVTASLSLSSNSTRYLPWAQTRLFPNFEIAF